MKTKLGVATVIGLGMTSTALSADLPLVDVEPIGYVATCDAYGAGYFQIPGKNTCLKLGGRVRVQAVSGNMANNDDVPDYHGDKFSEYSMYSRGYLYLTSMTASEIGTIKTYFEGLYEWSGDDSAAAFKAEDAYIQLGMGNASILVGRTESLFDGFIGYTELGTIVRNFSESYVNQAQLIYDLGAGISVGASVENGYARGGPANSIDFVGMAKIDQGWGSFRVSGGLHNTHDEDSLASLGVFYDSQTVTTLETGSGGYGFGVNATATLNLPATGTELAFQATYADSAITYLGGSTSFVTGLGDYADTFLLGIDNNHFDGALDYYGFNGWSLAAGIKQPVTETITFAVDGTYTQLSGNFDSVEALGTTWSGAVDVDRLAIDASLAWEPAEGLLLAVGGGWATTNLNEDYTSTEDVSVTTDTGYDELRVGTRVQYTF